MTFASQWKALANKNWETRHSVAAARFFWKLRKNLQLLSYVGGAVSPRRALAR
jgi:hypothetical protein